MLVAKDIMNPRVISIGPEATLGEAIKLLLDRRISSLPVVDAHDNLIGVITEYGLLAAAYDGTVRDESIAKHMTKNVFTVDVTASIKAIADVFIVHRVRRVPVLDGNRLVGHISRRDLLRAVETLNTMSAGACCN